MIISPINMNTFRVGDRLKSGSVPLARRPLFVYAGNRVVYRGFQNYTYITCWGVRHEQLVTIFYHTPTLCMLR